MSKVLPGPLYYLSLLTPTLYHCSTDLKTKFELAALQKELVRSFIVKCFFYLFEVMKHSLQFLAFIGISCGHCSLELLLDERYLARGLSLLNKINFIRFINLVCFRLSCYLFLFLNILKVVCIYNTIWLVEGFLVTNFYRILLLIWLIFILKFVLFWAHILSYVFIFDWVESKCY